MVDLIEAHVAMSHGATMNLDLDLKFLNLLVAIIFIINLS
jgi:hypothetical protein